MVSSLLRLKDNDEFVWTEEHQQAFENLENYLSKPSMMVPPVPGRPMKLYIFTEEQSIAGMIIHDDNTGVERSIYYLSMQLLNYECNYSPMEKLCFASYFTYTKLRAYLRPTTVYLITKVNIIKYIFSRPILHQIVGL